MLSIVKLEICPIHITDAIICEQKMNITVQATQGQLLNSEHLLMTQVLFTISALRSLSKDATRTCTYYYFAKTPILHVHCVVGLGVIALTIMRLASNFKTGF